MPGNLSTVEQVMSVGYINDALQINSTRNEADEATYEKFHEAGNGDGEANAFKHAYWNAVGTKAVGAKKMKLFTDAHEFGWLEENINNPEPMHMDLWNNAQGRYIGENYNSEALKWSTTHYLNTGQLQKIVNGERVWTNGGLYFQ